MIKDLDAPARCSSLSPSESLMVKINVFLFTSGDGLLFHLSVIEIFCQFNIHERFM